MLSVICDCILETETEYAVYSNGLMVSRVYLTTSSHSDDDPPLSDSIKF